MTEGTRILLALVLGLTLGTLTARNYERVQWTANAAKPEIGLEVGEGAYKVLTLTDYTTRCVLIHWADVIEGELKRGDDKP